MSEHEIVKVIFNKDKDEIITVVRNINTGETFRTTLYTSDLLNARLVEKIN